MDNISNWTNSYHEVFSKKNINLTQIEIWKSIFERKKTGMEKLKNWDENSKNNIQMIKILVDSMFIVLDQKLNESFNRYEKVYRYFSQLKLNFQTKVKLEPDLPLFKFESFSKTDMITEPKSTSFLNFVECFEQNLSVFQNQVNSFKAEIHKNINHKILSEKVKLKEASIKQLFTDIKLLKAKLQKISLLTSNKLSNLSKAFKEYFVDANKTKRPAINVFEFVFSFINHVKDLSEMIREYGNLFVSLYNESKALERERLEAMGESFSFFFKLTRQNFCPSLVSTLDPSIDLLGLINHTELIDNSYDVSKMLLPHQHELVKVTLGSSATSIDVISDFIRNSKYEENIKEIFEYFVLKIYKAEEVSSKAAKTKPIILFLTIDYFYTIYAIDEETREYELLNRFPIEETELNFKDAKLTTFTFYERNFLWKSKKKITLRFLADCEEEILLDHETFSLLLKPDSTDDSQSTKIHNKSFDDARDKSNGANSPDNTPEKVLKEDSQIEMNINKLLNNNTARFNDVLEKIIEEKNESQFTDERSLDVESRFSSDDIIQANKKGSRESREHKSREI